MTVALQSALVRIWNQENQIIGAGFLVTERRVLTCAHVVSDALDKPRQEMPSGPVHLDFPFVKAGEKVTAVVTLWQPKRPDGTGDIAGLELQASPPDGARPLRLVATPDTWNHPFRAFGFPIRHDQGVWASGVLRDRAANGHIQIEAIKTPGYSVQPGFSGTAVWDEALHGVVGMVVAAESKADTKAAFIIPTDKLIEAWPDLRAWATPPNPYRGLHAFRQEDADLFFGREAFVGQLATAVANKPFVAVIGASGSGKSSVVFAGLLPKVGRETAVVQFRPGSQPFRALADALLPIWQSELPGNERLEEAGKLAANLQAGKTQLLEVVNDILQRQPMGIRLLLVADQFEELYTLCPQKELRQAFVHCLVTAVQAQTGQHSPAFTLLLTMRADFMGQATEERPLADALQTATHILGPMTREELASAIEKPAQVVSVQFDPGLVTRILDDVGEEPGNLPLLEFALTLLWEQQSNGLLTHATYEAIGEVEGALAQYAEDQFGGLSQLEQEKARFIFTQLVQPGRGTEDTRRQATMSEISTANWGLVKWLADARLVVTNRNGVGEETAELVHEVLTRRWQRLREWVNENRRFREWQERLREAMRQWEAVKEEEAALLRGTLLAEAEGWLAERRGQLPSKEHAFIERSIEFSERTRLAEIRRRNVVLAVSLLATALFAVLGLFSYGQSQDLAVESTRAAANEGTAVAERSIAQGESTRADRNLATAVYNEKLAITREAEAVALAQITQSQALVSASEVNLIENPMRSLLLAIEAGQIADTPITLGALNKSLFLVGQPQQTLQHDSSINGALWDENGRQILAWSNNVVKVWEAVTGIEQFKLTHKAAVRGASWNRDGSQVLMWGCDEGESSPNNCDVGVLIVLDMVRREERLRLTHAGYVMGAVWNEDESRLLTWSYDHTAKIWDAVTGIELLRFTHGDFISSATWNKDESQIFTWGCEKTSAYCENNSLMKAWDASTGNLLYTLSYQSEGIAFGAKWNSGKNTILVLSNDGTIRIWDVFTGDLLNTIYHGVDVYGASWNEDGTRILTWGCSETYVGSNECVRSSVHIWNSTTGDLYATISFKGEVFGSIWNENQNLILTWGCDSSPSAGFCAEGSARLWDPTTGELQLALTHQGTIYSAAWNAGEDLIFTGNDDGTVSVWSAPVEKMSLRSPDEDLIEGVAWGNSGNLLIWSEENAIGLLNAPAGKIQLDLEIDDSISGAKLSYDETQILTWGCSEFKDFSCIKGAVRVWNALIGSPQITLEHPSRVYGAIWNKDESYILTWDKDNLRKWDSTTGELLMAIQTEGILGAIWNKSETEILTWDLFGSVRTWDANTGSLNLTIDQSVWIGEGITGASWNTDENAVLTWSWEGVAKVWIAAGEVSLSLHDEESGLIYPFTHSGWVLGAAWSENEKLILTWGSDGTAKTWDAITGNLYHVLVHEASIIGAAWNENNGDVLTWGEDNTVKVWDSETGAMRIAMSGDDTRIISAKWDMAGQEVLMVTQEGNFFTFHMNMGDLLKISCERATRNLLWREWQIYFPDTPYHPTCPALPCDSDVPDTQLGLGVCQNQS